MEETGVTWRGIAFMLAVRIFVSVGKQKTMSSVHPLCSGEVEYHIHTHLPLHVVILITHYLCLICCLFPLPYTVLSLFHYQLPPSLQIYS